MPRAIYTKEIYKREKQLTRKVYQRKNNVIPVLGENYVVSSITIQDGGAGYQVDDELTIVGTEDDTPAVITVSEVMPTRYTITSATASGTMTGYESGEMIKILGSEGELDAVLTITADNGSITGLAVTIGGEFDEDITGEVSTYEYEGSGEGLELSVVSEITEDSGEIRNITFTKGSYVENLSGLKELDSTTGTGAKFNVVMKPEIVGDDEDIPQVEESTENDETVITIEG